MYLTVEFFGRILTETMWFWHKLHFAWKFNEKCAYMWSIWAGSQSELNKKMNWIGFNLGRISAVLGSTQKYWNAMRRTMEAPFSWHFVFFSSTPRRPRSGSLFLFFEIDPNAAEIRVPFAQGFAGRSSVPPTSDHESFSRGRILFGGTVVYYLETTVVVT